MCNITIIGSVVFDLIQLALAILEIIIDGEPLVVRLCGFIACVPAPVLVIFHEYLWDTWRRFRILRYTFWISYFLVGIGYIVVSATLYSLSILGKLAMIVYVLLGVSCCTGAVLAVAVYRFKLKNTQKKISILSKTNNFVNPLWEQPIDDDDINREPVSFRQAVQYLKEVYRSECQIMRKHWSKLIDHPDDFDMDLMYMDLEILNEGKRTHEKLTCLQSLFGESSSEREHRKIILEGDPGMGKTTYLHRIVQMWAREEKEQGIWLNNEFELVILVRLGEVQSGNVNNLEEFLEAKYPADIWKCFTAFIHDATNHKRILFVLDAFDEMDRRCKYFETLIEEQCIGKLSIKNATLLISTRISHSMESPLKSRDMAVRTYGFHPDSVKKMLISRISDTESLEVLTSELSLYQTPLFAGMAVSVGHIPLELSDLIQMFCDNVFARFEALRSRELNKQKNGLLLPSAKRSTPPSNKQWSAVKKFISKLALAQLKPKLLFEDTDTFVNFPVKQKFCKCVAHSNSMNPQILKLCQEIGLLWPIKQLLSKSTDDAILANMQFPHKLFQEYFAAFGAVEQGITSELAKLKVKNKLELSQPFSYFMTAHSDCWKKDVLSESVSSEGELYFPWIYRVSELPDIPSLDSIKLKRFNCSTIPLCPDPGTFLENISTKYHMTPGSTLELSHIYQGSVKDSKISKFRVALGNLLSGSTGLTEFQFSYVTAIFRSKTLFESFPLTIIVLKLQCCDLSKVSVVSLSEYIAESRALRILDVKQNPVIGSVPQFMEALGSCWLEEVDISECSLNARSVLALSKSIQSSKNLKILEAQENAEVGKNPIFTHALRFSSLTVVDISKCDLSIEAVVALSQTVKLNSNLKSLKLSGNSIIGIIVDVAEAVGQGSLEEIDISGCKLTRETVMALSASIQQTKALKTLDVARNPIISFSAEFARAIFRSSLEGVDLYECKVGNQYCKQKFIKTFIAEMETSAKQFQWVIIRRDELTDEATMEKLESVPFVKLW